MKKSIEKNKRSSSAAREFLLPFAQSFFAGLLLYFICLSLFSLVVLKQNLSFNKMPLLLFISCLISAFGAGFVLSRRMQVKGLLAGVLAALPLMFVEMLILISMSQPEVGGHIYLLIPTMLVSGAVGGILAVNLKSRPRKRKVRK